MSPGLIDCGLALKLRTSRFGDPGISVGILVGVGGITSVGAGLAVSEQPDGLIVSGIRGGDRGVQGGVVRPEHDHRIAMAGAVLGLLASDETQVPSQDIATSFPTFANTLRGLGASLA